MLKAPELRGLVESDVYNFNPAPREAGSNKQIRDLSNAMEACSALTYKSLSLRFERHYYRFWERLNMEQL